MNRDEVLEAAFGRGDASAFDRAYERFSGRMYGVALRVLCDTSLARECVHDVFLHLWKQRTAYSPKRGSLEAFLLVCARNAALTRVRDDARRRVLLASQPPEPPVSTDADPLEHAHIEAALAHLTAPQATLIRKAYYAQKTLAEIAAESGEPLGTIKSRLSSALRALRSMLYEEAHT